MGSGVLSASSNQSWVRAYAHCAANTTDGAVTVLLLNLSPDTANNISLHLPASFAPAADAALAVEQYLLQGPAGANATQMALNGEVLRLTADGKLPPIVPKATSLPLQADGSALVVLPGSSFAFLTISGLGHAGC